MAKEYSTFPGEGDATFTIDDVFNKVSFGLFHVKVCLISGLGWMADCMEIMALSILGPILVCEWLLTPVQEALIVTVTFIGFLIGSPICGKIADLYGRKTALLLTCAWSLYFGILSAWSYHYVWLLILRALTGAGLSGQITSITYCCEFMPNRIRGRAMLLLQLFWAVGPLVVVFLAVVVLEPAGWRWWMMTMATPIVVFIILFTFMPESPRYLNTTGKMDDALKIVKSIAEQSNVELPEGQLKQEVHHQRGRFLDLLTPQLRRTTILLWIMWFSVSFCYYGFMLLAVQVLNKPISHILDDFTFSFTDNTCSSECHVFNHQDYIRITWMSVSELPALLLTTLLIDITGRKFVIAAGSIIFTLLCFLLFACQSRLAIIVLMSIARGTVGSTFPVICIYTPEIYPTEVRALGAGVGSVCARIGAILTPFIAQVLASYSIGLAVGVYGIVGLMTAVATLLLPLDTTGKDMN